MPDQIKTDMRFATIEISRVAKSLAGMGLLNRIGKEVSEQAMESAAARPGRSFWRTIHDSISSQSGLDSVVVGSTHEAAAQKQLGGVISAPGKGPDATKAKFLTIPVGEARENRWNAGKASDRFNLFLVKSRSGKRFLFGKKKTGKDSSPKLLFVLRKSVSQRPDPWFPSGNDLSDAIGRGIDAYRNSQGGA